MKGTKLYVPAATLSTRDNQKLSKLLSKGFGRLLYWNKYKTKSDKKLGQMNLDFLLNQIWLESIDYFF